MIDLDRAFSDELVPLRVVLPESTRGRGEHRDGREVLQIVIVKRARRE